MHTADALAALFNPTVNSYKRINAPPTPLGRHLVAEHGHLTGNNRTHMIRIPAAGRF